MSSGLCDWWLILPKFKCLNDGQLFEYDGWAHYFAIEPFLSNFCSKGCAYEYIEGLLCALSKGRGAW